jgi:hypothetical protein
MTTFGAVRTARIVHDCTVCGLPIQPGQQYREWRIPPGDIEVGNDKWARFRLHLNGQCNGGAE